MKNLLRLLLVALLTVGGASSLFAQVSAFRTGSLQLDTDLRRINVSAQADFGVFRTEISSLYRVPSARIDELHTSFRMSPADIFFSLEIGRVTNRSLEYILPIYQKNRGKGWGVIAKELGIKPGSPAFHSLKSRTNVQSKSFQTKFAAKNAGKGKASGKPQAKPKGNPQGKN